MNRFFGLILLFQLSAGNYLPLPPPTSEEMVLFYAKIEILADF